MTSSGTTIKQSSQRRAEQQSDVVHDHKDKQPFTAISTSRISRPWAGRSAQNHDQDTKKISNDEIIRDHGNQDVMPLQAPTRL